MLQYRPGTEDDSTHLPLMQVQKQLQWLENLLLTQGQGICLYLELHRLILG